MQQPVSKTAGGGPQSQLESQRLQVLEEWVLRSIDVPVHHHLAARATMNLLPSSFVVKSATGAARLAGVGLVHDGDSAVVLATLEEQALLGTYSAQLFPNLPNCS